jgi:hypothetical protein
MSRVYSLFHSIAYRLEHLDYQQLALLTFVLVVFGFWCMRGFGSRTNY